MYKFFKSIRSIKKIRTKILKWCFNEKEISIEDLLPSLIEYSCEIPDSNGNLKFINTYDTSGFYLKTPSGFSPATQLLKTVEYEIYEIKTPEFYLECADDHIVIDEFGNEVLTKNLKIGQKISTINGPQEIVSIQRTNKFENMYDFEIDDENHVYYTNGILSHNTTTASIFLLWYSLFNATKIIGLLANKGDLAREILSRYQTAYEYIPFWMQQGVIAWNKGSIELENGSKIIATSTSSNSARGFSFSLLYIDELAFVSHTVWEEFYTSVYPTISSGTESRIILTSTPNGLNHFWQMWNKAIEGLSNYAPFQAIWSDVPWRDEAWKQEQIANTSVQQFDQEHEASFLGSSNTLISTSTLENIITRDPTWIRSDGTRVFEKPLPDQKYIMVCDTARGYKQDYSVFVVFKVSTEPYEIVATFRNNNIDPIYFSFFINFYGRAYNNAHILVEINDAGCQVADNLFHEHSYENLIKTSTDKKTGAEKATESEKSSRRGVYTSQGIKSRGCTSLKTLMERNMLMVNDEQILSEATHFVRKKRSWAAEDGYHDDLMMTLVLFSWLVTQHSFGEIIDDDEFRGVNHLKRGQEISKGFMNTPIVFQSEDIEIIDGDIWIREHEIEHLDSYYNNLFYK